MPIGDKLVHSLVIVTPADDVGTDTDEYGQPVAGEPTTISVRGLIQPKSAREVALISQAGAQLSDHVVFLPTGTAIENASYVRYATDDGDRYQVVGVRDFNFGTVNDHLEVDAKRVHSEVLATS